MPSCSDSQAALMRAWFGSDVGDYEPSRFLLARGWTEREGMWYKPTSAYTPSIYEVECLLYLRDEWDYDFHKPLFPEMLSQ